ncbi:MAG: hypothetical protein ACRERU_16495 [Methylococcales bacterium]
MIVVLATALPHGLTEKRRRWLIEVLDIAPQTVSRWRHFWREVFRKAAAGRRSRAVLCRLWRSGICRVNLLATFIGEALCDRLGQLLVLVCRSLPLFIPLFDGAEIDPQKMRS